MYKEKSKKTRALLYWYILGVPISLVVFAIVLNEIQFPVIIGFSFLTIIMYAGIVSIMIILTNAIISTK
ncbi:MAG: hypothetical protein JSW60_05450 [Thermoplasmatales archaeon]|nr:MAG: hypothetical protein JSW60_05450 [Thermoplasmatales archaeon]